MLDVDVVRSAGATVLRVSGELDMATAGILRRALAEQHGAVVVDLREVEFIAAEGVARAARGRRPRRARTAWA